MPTQAIRFAFAVLAALSAASPGQAHPAARPFLALGDEVSAPRGFVEMCQSDVTFCQPGRSDQAGDDLLVTGALARQADEASARGAAPVPIAIERPTVTLGGVDTASVWQAGRSLWQRVGAAGDPTVIDIRNVAPDALIQTVSFAPEAAQQPEAPPAARVANTALSNSQIDALVQRVNRFVNERVLQRTDEQVYGHPEVWHRSGVGRGAAGDCEDIAIEKRIELIQAGFPADALYFAVVYEPAVGLHAVLIARTASGDLVLDSRSPYVNRWDQTAYSFVTIQSTREPMRWFAPGGALVETAEALPPALG